MVRRETELYRNSCVDKLEFRESIDLGSDCGVIELYAFSEDGKENEFTINALLDGAEIISDLKVVANTYQDAVNIGKSKIIDRWKKSIELLDSVS